jgi:hypothetical protein
VDRCCGNDLCSLGNDWNGTDVNRSVL